uniref:Uncharacterized protein n=1 Tax=Leersia perrieri TaxID=77586 RepID=A0A0D9WHJ7_9ORYZ
MRGLEPRSRQPPEIGLLGHGYCNLTHSPGDTLKTVTENILFRLQLVLDIEGANRLSHIENKKRKRISHGTDGSGDGHPSPDGEE